MTKISAKSRKNSKFGRGRPRKPVIISILKKKYSETNEIATELKTFIGVGNIENSSNYANCKFCGKMLKNKAIAFKVHERKCLKQVANCKFCGIYKSKGTVLDIHERECSQASQQISDQNENQNYKVENSNLEICGKDFDNIATVNPKIIHKYVQKTIIVTI